MGYRVKLSCTIPLDSHKEADMVKYMQELKNRHKLGDMVANCVRFCWENREAIEKMGFQADKSGLTNLREKYFKSINLSISEMKDRVDKIYDMAFKTYMLAQMGKYLGMEGKSKNSLSAQFLLERQLDEITKTLGMEDVNKIWESNRQASIEDKSKEILEFIIESYGDILDELKSNRVIIQESVKNITQDTVSIENTSSNSATKVIEYSSSEAVKEIPEIENTNEVQEEPIDFETNADFDLLNQFVGL